MAGPSPGKISSAPLRDGTLISVNDHVYMASEFIGESYYIGRVMEFGKETKGKPLQVRIGWFYRPKDVMARRNSDSRLLVATMHSDMNSISSIRGLCIVTHLAYIKDLESYRKQPDHFYYNQLFDRYIHRFYDVLPVDSVRNLPLDVATELSRRYQYIVVEAGTASEYTDAHRVCLICKRWCASGEALKCIMCQGFHHMLCINPPMLKKPSKGFAFQCALCSKLAMDSSSQPTASSPPTLQKHTSAIHIHTSASTSGQNSPRGSPKQKAVSTLAVIPTANGGTKSSQGSAKKSTRQDPHYLTPAAPLAPQDQKMSHMWPFRYFGTHADIQDIFDPDDRVYPRASSRVGTKYQAVVIKWDGPGQVLATSTIFDDPHSSSLKGRSRRGGRGGRPSNRLKVPEEAESRSRAHSAALETSADGLDTPVTPSSPARSGGAADDAVHVERGGSDTVTLNYLKPSHISEEYVAGYMERVKELALPLPSHSADVIDRALLTLEQSGYDADKALQDLALLKEKDLDVKDWTPEEVEAFEEGIRLYGHELFAIKKKVESRSMKDIVRFFYRWKKTERYQPVYSVFTKIHKPNKKFKSVGRGVVTSSAVEVGNRSKTGQELPKDSVLDYETIILPSTDNAGKFACAHCGTKVTSIWRRLPGETDPESQCPRVYCYDCGNDWVRYVALPPLADVQKDIKKLKGKDPSAKVLMNGPNKASAAASEAATAVKRKRLEAKTSVAKKFKEQSHEPTRSPSPLPELPCAVCRDLAARGEQLLTCVDCNLTVHYDCYGVDASVPHRKWLCDTCCNSQSPTCSTAYTCVLCTKSSDEGPQALKQTTGSNWAHILCAMWIPEINFVEADRLSSVELMGRVRPERWRQACSICKKKAGACVACGEGCKRVFHVTCARDAGYTVAFEMQPTKNVKGGLMVPVIWCPNHDLSLRKVIHIRDQPDALTDRNALQTYAHYYKQSDVSISNAMRRSRLLTALNPGIGAASSWQKHGYTSKGSGTRPTTPPAAPETCTRCLTTTSPIWWDSAADDQASGPCDKGLHSESALAVKVECYDSSLSVHAGHLAARDEQQRCLICHACFWDAKAVNV
ncbi:unnamed protein product [Mortierella alpina]